MSHPKTNPFKTSPLSQAGDSGRRRVLDRLSTEVHWLCGAMAIIGLLGGFNLGLLVGRDFGASIGPSGSWIIIGTSVAVMAVVLVVAYRRGQTAEAAIDHEALGIEGERVVANALDELKGRGFRVYQDVPPEREGEGLANFDHVVIGPTGVFVIETKARTKAEGRENKIVVTFDGRVLINGFEPDRCPIAQAKALRDAMKRMLERQTSIREIFVRGVVLFPEWNIDDKAYQKAGGDIWTLNPPAFKKWLTNGRDPIRLKPDDIALLSSRIEDHVRNVAAARRTV